MEGNITHTAIISYSYGTVRLKEGPNQPEPIFSTLYLNFIQIFSLINYSLWDPHYICPQIFYFCDPILQLLLRLTFRDSTHDSHLRLTFRDSHLRLMFCDSTHDSHLRLTFATSLATPVRDSRSRLFFTTSPSCDSTTDRQTVSTPQHHLPSVPTLTLIIKKFGTFSLAWPPPLATAHHHVHLP